MRNGLLEAIAPDRRLSDSATDSEPPRGSPWGVPSRRADRTVRVSRRSRTLVPALVLVLVAPLGGCFHLLNMGGGEPWHGAHDRESLARVPDTATQLSVRGIGDDAIPALSRFKQLRSLNLSSGIKYDPQRVTERGFRELATLDLPNLETLLIARSDGVTDEAVEAISRIRTLRILHLIECQPFSARGIESLATLPHLELLDVRGCSQVDDASVPAMKSLHGLTTVRSLRVTRTGLSPSAIEELRSALGEAVDDRYWDEP